MIDVLIEQLNAFQPNMEALREYSVVISKLMDFLTISKIILNPFFPKSIGNLNNFK